MLPGETLETTSPWVALAMALAIAIVTGWGVLWLRRAKLGFERRRRARRAQSGEASAKRVLERAGYRVVESQARVSHQLRSDGRTMAFELIADYIVQRSGLLWVAEVKTGARSLDLRHGPTRRQLLEYALCFPVEGVLLVDPEGQRVHRIDFVDLPARGRSSRARWLLAAGAGLAVGYALAQLGLS